MRKLLSFDILKMPYDLRLFSNSNLNVTSQKKTFNLL